MKQSSQLSLAPGLTSDVFTYHLLMCPCSHRGCIQKAKALFFFFSENIVSWRLFVHVARRLSNWFPWKIKFSFNYSLVTVSNVIFRLTTIILDQNIRQGILLIQTISEFHSISCFLWVRSSGKRSLSWKNQQKYSLLAKLWEEENFNLNFSVLQTKRKGNKEMTCASVL